VQTTPETVVNKCICQWKEQAENLTLVQLEYKEIKRKSQTYRNLDLTRT
jgi:hypothetical protein